MNSEEAAEKAMEQIWPAIQSGQSFFARGDGEGNVEFGGGFNRSTSGETWGSDSIEELDRYERFNQRNQRKDAWRNKINNLRRKK